MKKILIFVIMSLLILFIFQCNQDPTTRTSVNLRDAALIDFPTCINDTSGSSTAPISKTGKKLVSQSVVDGAKSLFEPIRTTYIPIAYDVRKIVKSLIDEADLFVFDTDAESNPTYHETALAVQNELNNNSVFTNSNSTRKIKIERTNQTYTIQIWNAVTNLWEKTVHLIVTKNSNYFNGTLYGKQISTNGNAICQLDFDNNDSTYGKVMTIRGANFASSSTLTNVPTQLWIKATLNDDVFKIAGNIFYECIDLNAAAGSTEPFITWTEDYLIDGVLSTNTPQDVGTNLKGSYIFSGGIDWTFDRGAVKLALVPTNIGTADYFTEYRVGKVYSYGIVEAIKNDSNVPWLIIDAMQSNINSFTDTNLNDIPVTNLPLNSNSSYQDIMTCLGNLEYIYDTNNGYEYTNFTDITNYITETQWSNIGVAVQDYMFIVKVVNPAYFDAATGYLGTEEVNRPSWYAEVTNYTFLSIDVTPTQIATDTNWISNLDVLMNTNPDF